jgi:hypothetical protein
MTQERLRGAEAGVRGVIATVQFSSVQFSSVQFNSVQFSSEPADCFRRIPFAGNGLTSLAGWWLPRW